MFLLKLICAIAPVIILGGLLYHRGLGAIIIGFFINKSLNQSTTFKIKVLNLIFAFCAAVFLRWTENANIYLLQNLNFNIYGVLSALFAYFATPIFLIFAFKYIKKVRATSVDVSQNKLIKEQGYDSE